jgi:hypothetical protein
MPLSVTLKRADEVVCSITNKKLFWCLNKPHQISWRDEIIGGTNFLRIGVEDRYNAHRLCRRKNVKGWEVIGIEPDVKVSRREAVDAARKLAESRR